MVYLTTIVPFVLLMMCKQEDSAMQPTHSAQTSGFLDDMTNSAIVGVISICMIKTKLMRPTSTAPVCNPSFPRPLVGTRILTC